MSRAPWYHWPIALATLLWYVGGAADYALTRLRVPAYLSQFSPDQVAYFQSMPTWVDAAWAVGVWVGLVGAVLLVMRMGIAVLPLAASCAAMVAATVWLLVLSDPPMAQVTGMLGVWIMVGVAAASLVIYIYARAMRVMGVLA
ncbi:MAG: hypothetical protein ACE368_08660 [Paracoccaceae bacterium]